MKFKQTLKNQNHKMKRNMSSYILKKKTWKWLVTLETAVSTEMESVAWTSRFKHTCLSDVLNGCRQWKYISIIDICLQYVTEQSSNMLDNRTTRLQIKKQIVSLCLWDCDTYCFLYDRLEVMSVCKH